MNDLEIGIDEIRTKTREEIRPLQMRIKEVRDRFLKKLAETHVDGPAVSETDLREKLKVGKKTITQAFNEAGCKTRRLKDDEGEWWIVITKKEEEPE